MRFVRVVLILLIAVIPLAAYVPRRVLTPAGLAFERWADSSFPIVWRLNTSKGSNITGTRDLAELVRLSSQAWSSVSTAQVSFSEGDTTTTANAAFDQVNLISFAPASYASDTPALTVLYSFTQTGTDSFGRKIEFPGQILEADVLFNPAVQFSTDATPPSDRIDLQSQITHEIGHLLGLDHSGLASAVMFPTLTAGTTHLRTLSTDDAIGISTLYPASVFSTLRGGIRGAVRSPAGSAVFGAHVVIVDSSGRPVVSTLTGPDGSYQVQGLEAGSYSAYAEPLDAPVGAAAIVSLATAYPATTVSTQFTTRFSVPSPTTAALTLTKTGGDNQTANAGEALANALEVQVRDAGNNLAPGVVVSFAAASGGGAVVPLTAIADSQGKARTTAYLGRGQNQWFTASADGSVIGFAATKKITISSITLVDIASNSRIKELIVNAGNTIQARTRILDSSGSLRTDVSLSYASTNIEVASVDSAGNIQGKKAGFSTLTISGGGVVSASTITVVEVASGVASLETTGVAEGQSGQIYLAATLDHTVRSTPTLAQTATVYAGSAGVAGLVNGQRLASRFRNPAFLAVDSGSGAIYVSDSGNHVIRKIVPTADSVETFAGTGSPGNLDGAAVSAAFNNPQGIALDNAGYLWVVDSGNHTIRRIHLTTKNVETVAGLSGAFGLADGLRDQARFSSPAGIALEPETLTGQLDRFVRGGAPPPVRMLVADTGNGSIRRVQADGQVQTITATGASAALLDGNKPSVFALTAPAFESPTGITVDRFGSIYVSEPGKDRVRVILRTGEIVSLAQPNTARLPKGLFVDELGQVLLAESGHGVQKITYGAPEITQVTPDPTPGGQITIKGVNFAPDSVTLAEGLPNAQQLTASGKNPDVSIFATHITPDVQPAAWTFQAIGETKQFTAAPIQACGQFDCRPEDTVWMSDNETVARVNAGLVTAVANGTATITAKLKGEGSATALVTVLQAVSRVQISPDNPTLDALGKALQFTAVAKDSQGNTISGKIFNWTLSQSGTVATLSATTGGLVTAVANGTATITASVDGVSGTTGLTVAQAVSTVTISPDTRTLTALGLTQPFTALAKDSNGNTVSGKTFTWESSAGNVASVNSTTGVATALANGTSTIKATVDGVSGTATLTVAQTVSSVDVNPANPTLTAIGATLTLTAVAKDANGNEVSGKAFTWASSVETVASINSTTGIATAVANGTSTITATTGAFSGTTLLTVDEGASPVVSTVTVSPSSKTLSALGNTQEFSAVAKNAAGNTLSGRTFVWTSSTPGVATVNSSTGVATAVANGTSTITASVDAVSGTALLTVAQTVSSVVVSPGSATLTALGATEQLTVAVKDAGGSPISGKTAAWTSSAPSVATVDAATGLVAAVANGTATITASVDGIAGTATVTVGQTVSSIAVTPGTATLVSLGATRQFTAVAKDANGNAISGKTFTWTSSAVNVATVSSTAGLATAVANGTSSITASVDGVSGTAALTVAQAVATVVVTPSATTLGFVGDLQQFTAVARDSNGNAIPGKTFTWTSSAPGIATVNSAGLATAVAFGNTTITASVDGVSGAAALRVLQKLLISNFRLVDTETIVATVPATLTGAITIGVLNRSGAWPWVITPEGLR